MIKVIDYAINQQILPDGNFVFLDCETANRNQEICQIGAIVVSKNKVIEKIDKYVKPKGDFEFNNVKIHGITPYMVKNEEHFDVIWNTYLSKYVNDFIFVCHNAESADLPAIWKSLQILDCVCPNIKYICTQKMSEKSLKHELKSFGIEDVCEFFS